MTQIKIISFLQKLKWFGFKKIYWIVKRQFISLEELFKDNNILYPAFQQSLIKRSISRKLINIYNGDEGHNLNYTQFFLGFGLIHYSFIRNLQPKNILCVGSRKGYIPAILALACKDNAMGHVDFVDAGYDEENSGKNWSGVGFWRKNNSSKHFSKIGIKNFITTHVMTSQEFAKKYHKKRYQYVYIDGDHSYEGVKKDYGLFWSRLDKGCFMSFHDVVAQGQLDGGLFGVWKFWKEIKNKHAIIFPFPKDSGLGMIQKL